MRVDPAETALILVGFQNDYFSPDGVLHHVIEESSKTTNVLNNTIELIESLTDSDVLMIDTPIAFTEGYTELSDNAPGILNIIRESNAFKANTPGSQVIPEIEKFRERLIQVPGKRGLDCFANTDLNSLLKDKGIKNICLAGTVTSVCIDSTGRSAFEKGYSVTILEDCTSARTNFEQENFCKSIFPLYAQVTDYKSYINELMSDGKQAVNT